MSGGDFVEDWRGPRTGCLGEGSGSGLPDVITLYEGPIHKDPTYKDSIRRNPIYGDYVTTLCREWAPGYITYVNWADLTKEEKAKKKEEKQYLQVLKVKSSALPQYYKVTRTECLEVSSSISHASPALALCT
eukprot:TRINITY_DN5580_c0_g1_i2.p1 TRINITY_DN5580_c0_g1~~TRINITY_DN5580_c0_g1_i2.p1  ORF type:complete len:149 (+),score=35.08 TRINITY_DN5580_c0_g1_i2:53-448(+)